MKRRSNVLSLMVMLCAAPLGLTSPPLAFAGDGAVTTAPGPVNPDDPGGAAAKPGDVPVAGEAARTGGSVMKESSQETKAAEAEILRRTKIIKEVPAAVRAVPAEER
jgi:hypothetical protein